MGTLYYVKVQYLEEWSIYPIMVSKIWVGIIIFIYTSIQNSKSLANTRTLNAGVHSFRIKSLEFVLFQSSFCFIYHWNSLTKMPSWEVWGLLFVIKPSNAISKWFILAQITQRLEFINLKLLSYRTHLGILNHVFVLENNVFISDDSPRILSYLSNIFSFDGN